MFLARNALTLHQGLRPVFSNTKVNALKTFLRLFRPLLLETIILLLVFAPSVTVRPQNQPPVLTFNAGEGVSAELTDYGLTNYGVTSVGQYQGTMCFTLTNTSLQPFYLGAVGLRDDILNRSFTLVSSNSSSNAFVGVQWDNWFGIEEVSAAFIVPLFPEILGPSIGPMETGSFCMTVSSNREFTLTELISRLTVVLADEASTHEIPLYFGYFNVEQSQVEASARIKTSIDANNNTCFEILNLGERVITGISIEVPFVPEGIFFPFQLVSPIQQVGNQRLVFSSPAPIFPPNQSPNQKFGFHDIGLLTGKSLTTGIVNRGIRPGSQSVRFCISGWPLYTSGPQTITLPTTLWYEGQVKAFSDEYGQQRPTGGIRGNVATNPQ